MFDFNAWIRESIRLYQNYDFLLSEKDLLIVREHVSKSDYSENPVLIELVKKSNEKCRLEANKRQNTINQLRDSEAESKELADRAKHSLELAQIEKERSEQALIEAQNARLEAEAAKITAENLRSKIELKLSEQTEANVKLSRVEAQNRLARWFLWAVVLLIALPIVLIAIGKTIPDIFLQTYKELLFLLIPILSVVFAQLYGAKKSKSASGVAEVEN